MISTIRRIDLDVLAANARTLAAAGTPYRCRAFGCEQEPCYVFTVFPRGMADWSGSRNWQLCSRHAHDGGEAASDITRRHFGAPFGVSV